MKTFFALIAVLLIAGAAKAHFPFILPVDDGTRIQVVFNDVLAPDDRAPIDHIAATTLFAVDEAGRKTPLKWTMTTNALGAELPKRDSLIVGGFTNRGFVHSKHTENKPVWVKHYPKAVVGNIAAAGKTRLGGHIELEIVPVLANKQLRFLILWRGKPQPQSNVAVLTPGAAKARLTTTDDEGLTKEAFHEPGRYGARVGYIEKAEGVLDGKKYEQIRSYATLVLDFDSASR